MISSTLRRAAWIVCRNVKGCAGGATVGGVKGEEFLKTIELRSCLLFYSAIASRSRGKREPPPASHQTLAHLGSQNKAGLITRPHGLNAPCPFAADSDLTGAEMVPSTLLSPRLERIRVILNN